VSQQTITGWFQCPHVTAHLACPTVSVPNLSPWSAFEDSLALQLFHYYEVKKDKSNPITWSFCE